MALGKGFSNDLQTSQASILKLLIINLKKSKLCTTLTALPE